MKIQLKIIQALFLSICLAITACSKDDEEYKGKSDAIFNASLTYGSVTDMDGNTYKTIQIGTQTWMAENLRVTHYNNGKTIDKVNDDTQWKTTSKGAYCTYNLMNDADSIATFGYLYNWHAVNTGNLAPTGWHVPTEADWDLLYNYLFSNTNRSQTTLFEVSTLHWEAPNSKADNSTGFTAIPSGYRDYSGSRFMNMNTGANYWSSTMNQSNGVCYIYLTADDPEPHISLSGNENFGFAVRCIKD